jgi:hypothetical protein
VADVAGIRRRIMNNVISINKNVHVQPSMWSSKGFVLGITLLAIGTIVGFAAPAWLLLTS